MDLSWSLPVWIVTLALCLLHAYRSPRTDHVAAIVKAFALSVLWTVAAVAAFWGVSLLVVVHLAEPDADRAFLIAIAAWAILYIAVALAIWRPYYMSMLYVELATFCVPAWTLWRWWYAGVTAWVLAAGLFFSGAVLLLSAAWLKAAAPYYSIFSANPGDRKHVWEALDALVESGSITLRQIQDWLDAGKWLGVAAATATCWVFFAAFAVNVWPKPFFAALQNASHERPLPQRTAVASPPATNYSPLPIPRNPAKLSGSAAPLPNRKPSCAEEFADDPHGREACERLDSAPQQIEHHAAIAVPAPVPTLPVQQQTTELRRVPLPNYKPGCTEVARDAAEIVACENLQQQPQTTQLGRPLPNPKPSCADVSKTVAEMETCERLDTEIKNGD